MSAVLLTADEAAARLCVCTKTLGRLRRGAKIKFVAITGRKFLYRAEDCDAYLDSVTGYAASSVPAQPQPGRRTARVVPFPGKSFAELHG